jgi:hypothetical protein
MPAASLFAGLALTGAVTFGQEFRTETIHGRQAYVLENRRIRIGALRGGGHLAEIRLRDGDARRTVNPMRIPHYPTIEPYRYDPTRHDALYGNDSHRWLSSGYMGHLLCFPVFGPPSSPDEVKQGLGNHGEAPIVEWKPVGKPERTATGLAFRYGADLPKTQFRVDRKLTIGTADSAVLVEEWVENLAPFDRPIHWVQHATFGPPFIEPGKCFLDLSGTRAQAAGGSVQTSSVKPGADFVWPNGLDPAGQPVSLRVFQPKPNAGTYFAVLMDRSRPLGWFTMYNPEFPVLIGYLFRSSESPWLGDFQENRRLRNKPWDGKVVTRGIEFGTTPFAEGLRRSIERGSLFGAPTYRWIGGRARLATTYALFLAEIPAGFQGVDDVTFQGGVISLRERGSGRRIPVPAAALSAMQ